MNSLDKKLHEIFSPDYFVDRMGNIRISKEPQLHDVFRVAKERGWGFDMNEKSLSFVDENGFEFCQEDMESPNIPYNPTLPLMQQEDSTKQSLIDLFSFQYK